MVTGKLGCEKRQWNCMNLQIFIASRHKYCSPISLNFFDSACSCNYFTFSIQDNYSARLIPSVYLREKFLFEQDQFCFLCWNLSTTIPSGSPDTIPSGSRFVSVPIQYSNTIQTIRYVSGLTLTWPSTFYLRFYN